MAAIAPEFVEKEHTLNVCWRWSSRGGTNAALVETLGFIGVSALLQVALLVRGLRRDAVVGLAL